MKSEEHRIVEESRYMVLIISDIGHASIENFSHLENARCGGVLRPEIFWNLWDGVDADAVKIVV